jgi:hypothetical protein
MMSNRILATLPLLLSVLAIAKTVVTNPTGNQNIVQPVNTNFSANNVAGIRYVVSNSWGIRSKANALKD